MPSGWVKHGELSRRQRLMAMAEIAYWHALSANEAVMRTGWDPAKAWPLHDMARAHRWVYQLVTREILLELDRR